MQLRHVTLWRRLFLWGSVLFVFGPATLVEAGPREGSEADVRVAVVGEVRLPQATRFALIRNPGTGHLGLYKAGEAIFVGKQPLPMGKVVAVREQVLVLVLPTGRIIEIARGGRLPGPHRLMHIRSAVLDTLRYQIRFGAATTSSSTYGVVEIVGRRVILERRASPGEGQATAGPPAVSESPSPWGTLGPGGPTPAPEGATLGELVNRTPFTEVAPDTWEAPRREVQEIGNRVGTLLIETLRSASPTVTMKDGVGLKLHNSLGSGTLDRRGFKIGYAKMAQRTGLEVGDVIVSVNEQPVNSAGGLFRIYRTLKSDSTVSEVKVVIERNNTLRTLTYRIR